MDINNTKNIGVAFCGNLHFSEKDLKSHTPLTRVQLEAGFKLLAELSIKYGIPVTAQGIFTPFPNVEINEVGDFIRGKVRWYKSHFNGKFTLI